MVLKIFPHRVLQGQLDNQTIRLTYPNCSPIARAILPASCETP